MRVRVRITSMCRRSAAWAGHSFPSGHVAHVTALFGFLFFLTLLVRRAHPERWAWLLPLQVICVYFIALIGFSRVILVFAAGEWQERAPQPTRHLIQQRDILGVQWTDDAQAD